MPKHSEKDLIILNHLRKNSRKSLAVISRETGIPVSTIFDKIAKLERGIIKKYTTLVDFSKIGYNLRINFMIKSSDNNKNALKGFLESNPHVNTLLRINNGYDFYAEMVFKEMSELENFKENLQKMGIKETQEHCIIEDVKKEEFLARDEELLE